MAHKLKNAQFNTIQKVRKLTLIRLDNTAFTFSNSFLILKSDKEKWNSLSSTLSNSPFSKQFNKVHIILPGSNLCEILFLKSVAIRVTYPDAVVPLLSCVHLSVSQAQTRKQEGVTK